MQNAIIAATALIVLSQIPNAAGPVVGRPSRPRNPIALAAQLNGERVRPSISDVEGSVEKVKTKERIVREEQKPRVDELRHDVRAQVTEIKAVTKVRVQELQDSMDDARAKATEQARKIQEELNRLRDAGKDAARAAARERNL